VDDGETGLLAPIGDVSALAAHIERLRTDDSLRRTLGAEGAQRVRDRFSTARMVDDVELLYRRILGA
jgi:glycosyltransferase involved in cell wall biosynthesis